MTETTLVHRLLRRASALGYRLFRNNTGVLRDANGRYVAYGLCVGSSDLIGWRSIVVGPEHVGQRLAVFVAVEAKVGRNQPTPEQRAFLAAVRAAGGEARVIRDTAELMAGVE